jgi:hypothetical protein
MFYDSKPFHLGVVLLALTLSTASPGLHGATAAPTIGVAVTLNDGVSASLVRGWPWTLRVSAFAQGGVSAPPSLAPETVKVTVVSQGKPAAWSWQPSATKPAGAEAWLFLRADQTAQIGPGDYQLTVTWGGVSASTETVTVLPTADASVGATPSRQAQLVSAVAALQGDATAALAAINTARTSDPTSLGLLMDQAQLLEQAGRIDEALAAVDAAVALFKKQNPGGKTIPVSLIQVQSRLFNASVAAASNEPPAASTSTPAPAAAAALPTLTPTKSASAPTLPVAPTPVAATTATSAPSPAKSLPTAAPAAALNAPVGTPSAGQRVALAVGEAQVLSAPNAQWASSASASSRYGAERYAEQQATGQPNVSIAGNDPQSWCPAIKGSGAAWLELSFPRPVSATEVRVRQNNGPGAIVKVEAIDTDGVAHLWWSGQDPYIKPRVAEIAWFNVRVPATDYRVRQIRLTFDLSLVQDWVEVDAVQLVGGN